MSRSAFAARSKMQLALQSLKDEGARIGELASRLGYQSEAAFSRAFKVSLRAPPMRLAAAA